ncbi:YceI family protein [Aggregatimonas sangjinii]|uniref:YceI family protein n=1 Tax=Aggregatimonas sangjinii TaxID=2583587 RepID=A0A5B7SLX0_9FLAO|nr:YceI family protein [Aggregatimonas sangjinii]QCW99446.1 YceI family protein [Aggregatimonas sangjinii]
MKKKWKVAMSRSQVGFNLYHLNIPKIVGQLELFSGYVLQTNPDGFQDASFRLQAKASSVNTRNQERDSKLCSPEFLDVGNHPDIVFVSNRIVQIDPAHYIIKGNLSITGISKFASLTAHLGITANDQNGPTKIVFEITGQLLSTDYGMRWYEETPEGTQTWSHVVSLHMFLELLPEEPFE